VIMIKQGFDHTSEGVAYEFLDRVFKSLVFQPRFLPIKIQNFEGISKICVKRHQ
jgi:hypothetical protein